MTILPTPSAAIADKVSKPGHTKKVCRDTDDFTADTDHHTYQKQHCPPAFSTTARIDCADATPGGHAPSAGNISESNVL